MGEPDDNQSGEGGRQDVFCGQVPDRVGGIITGPPGVCPGGARHG